MAMAQIPWIADRADWVVPLYGLVSLYFWSIRILNGGIVGEGANVSIFTKMFITPTADQDEQRLLDQRRRESFQELASLWCLVLDVLMLALFILQACGILEPMVQYLPFFFAVVIAVELMRRIAVDKERVTPARLDRDVTIISILVFIATLGIPREFMPACYLARTLCFSFTCSKHSNKVNIILAPFYVMSRWITRPVDGPPERLELHIFGEVLAVTYMAMLVTNLDTQEHKLATASVELEAKVKQVQEAEREGGAAQRLLSVTCDASVRLSHDLHVQKTSDSLNDLLMCNFGRGSKATLDGTPFMRYVAGEDRERFKDFIAESTTADAPARSLHVNLKDSSGVPFAAELFHVTVPGLAEEPEHLIGVTSESNATDRVGRMENLCPSSDMRHVIGFGVETPSLPSRKSASQESKSVSEASSGSIFGDYKSLKGLVGIDLLIDSCLETDYLIRQLTFKFASNRCCDAELLPNLLEWLKPHYRQPISHFIGEYLKVSEDSKASHRHKSKREMPLVKILSPFPASSVLLAKKMKVGQVLPLYEDEEKKFLSLELRQLFAR